MVASQLQQARGGVSIQPSYLAHIKGGRESPRAALTSPAEMARIALVSPALTAKITLNTCSDPQFGLSSIQAACQPGPSFCTGRGAKLL